MTSFCEVFWITKENGSKFTWLVEIVSCIFNCFSFEYCRESGIPRIEQIILPDRFCTIEIKKFDHSDFTDRFCTIEIKKFDHSDFTYISSISAYLLLPLFIP